MPTLLSRSSILSRPSVRRLVRTVGANVRDRDLRATYRKKVEALLRPIEQVAVVSEHDLGALPPLVQRYLKNAGVVGQPRVHNVRVRWKGAIRNGQKAPWMRFTAEQLNTFGADPARLFLIEGARFGVPVVGLHVYEQGTATMQVRLARLVDVVDARGPEMDQGETVTVLADMCAFAPAALIDAPIVWERVDARCERATFTNARHTVSGVLVFDDAGDLVDFQSDDRFMTADGKTYEKLPWSTPMRGYRSFDGVRLAAAGDAQWQTPAGTFVYGRFELDDVAYNVTAP